MNDDSDSLRPEEIKWHEEAPEGKLDLLINLDFRMAEQHCILISSYLLQLGTKNTI